MILDVARLIIADSRKSLTLWLRYPIQPVLGLTLILLLFGGFFYGVRAIGTPTLLGGGNPNLVVITYFCWITAMSCAGQISTGLEEDAKIGQLDVLFTSRIPASIIILSRSIASSLSGILLSIATLLLTARFAGATIAPSVHLLTAFVILDIALSGVGIALAGLTVAIKRISSLLSIFYLGFGILVAAAVNLEPSTENAKLPLLSAVELFTRACLSQQVPITQQLGALGLALLSFAAGLLFFNLCVRHAKHTGSLSHA